MVLNAIIRGGDKDAPMYPLPCLGDRVVSQEGDSGC